MSTMYSSCTEYRRLFLRIFPIPLLLTHKKITRFTCIVLQHLKYFLHFMNYQCPFSIACLQSVCLHADEYSTVSSRERMVLSIKHTIFWKTRGAFKGLCSILHQQTLSGPVSLTNTCCAPTSKISVWSMEALTELDYEHLGRLLNDLISAKCVLVHSHKKMARWRTLLCNCKKKLQQGYTMGATWLQLCKGTTV